MTRESRDFEDIRYVLKKEQKKPTVYAQNRRESMLIRAAKIGDKAAKEIIREFKLDSKKTHR